MDWDLAIKRNSKALKAIIEVLFALLGLDGTRCGFADSALAAQRRAGCAAARRIRRAPPDRHRGAGCCGEAGALAADASEGHNHRQRRRNFPSLLPALRSAQTSEARAGHESHPASPTHPFLPL